jgi:hypothetical protein
MKSSRRLLNLAVRDEVQTLIQIWDYSLLSYSSAHSNFLFHSKVLKSLWGECKFS